jgi:hypothetical protein
VPDFEVAQDKADGFLHAVCAWTLAGGGPGRVWPEWNENAEALTNTCKDLARVFQDSLDSIYAPSREEA